MIRTFQDLVDQLTDLVQFQPGTRGSRHARRAVQEAYAEITRIGNFSRYDKQAQFVVPDEYITGTVAYSNATQLVTLSGGTWPTDVEYKRLVISTIAHRVLERQSDTVIKLGPADNPGADVTAGTSFRLITDTFRLPEDFRIALQVVDAGSQQLLSLSQDQSRSQYRFLAGEALASTPDQAVISSSMGQRAVMTIVPPPAAGTVLAMLYKGNARPLNIECFDIGTVTLVSGSTIATFNNLTDSGAILPADCAGATIRVAAGQRSPTNIVGREVGGKDVNIPIAFETTIAERLTDATARLDDPPGANFTACGYVISDPLDIDHSIMLQPLCRLAEAAFLGLMFNGSKEGLARLQIARATAVDALRAAMEYDYKVISSDGGNGPSPLWMRPVVTAT